MSLEDLQEYMTIDSFWRYESYQLFVEKKSLSVQFYSDIMIAVNLM